MRWKATVACQGSIACLYTKALINKQGHILCSYTVATATRIQAQAAAAAAVDESTSDIAATPCSTSVKVTVTPTAAAAAELHGDAVSSSSSSSAGNSVGRKPTRHGPNVPLQCAKYPRLNTIVRLQQVYASQPKTLMSRIKNCRDWLQLQQLLQEAGLAANHIHITAAVVHCAQLLQRQPQQQFALQQCVVEPQAVLSAWLLEMTQQLLQQHSSSLETRHTANLLWALAKCCRQQEATAVVDALEQLQMQQFQQCLQLQQQYQQMQHCKRPGSSKRNKAGITPQDMSNSIWALATLSHQPCQQWLDVFWVLTQQQLSNASAQEISNIVWAMAKLGLQPPSSCSRVVLEVVRSRLRQQQRQQEEATQVPPAALQAVSSTSSSSSNKGGGHNSSSSRASGTARQQLPQQQQQQQQRFNAQALANTAHGLASLNIQPNAAWLSNFFAASQPQLAHFASGQLSMTFWAIAGWQEDVPASWLAAFTAAVQQQLHALSDQGIVNIAASCYKLLQRLAQQQEQQAPLEHKQQQQQMQEQPAQMQLQALLAMMLTAAAGRLQTLPVSAVAALAWASAGLIRNSSSSSSNTNSNNNSGSYNGNNTGNANSDGSRQDTSRSSAVSGHDDQWQQLQVPLGAVTNMPAVIAWLPQYVALHTAALSASQQGTYSRAEAAGEAVLLLWLCAKASRLPSSAEWCSRCCHDLHQQIAVLQSGQLARLSWSLAQLLPLAISTEYYAQHESSVVHPVDDKQELAVDSSTHTQPFQQQLDNSSNSMSRGTRSRVGSRQQLAEVEYNRLLVQSPEYNSHDNNMSNNADSCVAQELRMRLLRLEQDISSSSLFSKADSHTSSQVIVGNPVEAVADHKDPAQAPAEAGNTADDKANPALTLVQSLSHVAEAVIGQLPHAVNAMSGQQLLEVAASCARLVAAVDNLHHQWQQTWQQHQQQLGCQQRLAQEQMLQQQQQPDILQDSLRRRQQQREEQHLLQEDQQQPQQVVQQQQQQPFQSSQQHAASILPAIAAAAVQHVTSVSCGQLVKLSQTLYHLSKHCQAAVLVSTEAQQAIGSHMRAVIGQLQAGNASAPAAAADRAQLALWLLKMHQALVTVVGPADPELQQSQVLEPLQHQQEQQLHQVLSSSMDQLEPQALLKVAHLSCRLQVVLPGSLLSDLLYALRSHISSYSPKQLLQVLLLLQHWRVPPQPAAAAAGRSALLAGWLRATHQYMLAQLQQQCQGDQHQQAEQHQGQQHQQQQLGSRCGEVSDLLSCFIVGLARQRLRPPDSWLQLFEQLLLQQLSCMSGGQLAKTLLGLARLQYKPDYIAVQLLLQRSQQHLPSMSRSNLVKVLHAVAKLGMVPADSWLQEYYKRALSAPGTFQVSGFGMMVWALAKIGAKPDLGWMQQLLDTTFDMNCASSSGDGDDYVGQCRTGSWEVAGKLQQMQPQHLANMICAFAKLDFTPGPEWMSWFRAQVGQQAGALEELDHFHIEWAWRELNEQYRAAADAISSL